jgi:hypothetical protein
MPHIELSTLTDDYPPLVTKPVEVDAVALDAIDATRHAADAGVPEGLEVVENEHHETPPLVEDAEPQSEAVASGIGAEEQEPADTGQPVENSPDEPAPPRDTKPLHQSPEAGDKGRGHDEQTGEAEPLGEITRAAGAIAIEEVTPESHEVDQEDGPRAADDVEDSSIEPREAVQDAGDPPAGDPEGIDEDTRAEESLAHDDQQVASGMQVSDRSGGGKDNPPPETAQGNEGAEEPEMITCAEFLEQTSRYIELKADGSMQFLDPVTGTPIVGETIPESLQADETQRKGYEYLTRNSDRIDMRLLLSAHEWDTDLTRAGIDLRTEATRLAERGGVLFIEGIAEEENQKLSAWADHVVASGMRGKQLEDYMVTLHNAQQAGSHSFDTEVAMQIAGTGVEVALPDFVENSDDPMDKVMSEFHGTYGAYLLPTNNKEEELKTQLARVGITAAYVRFRDQYLVGKVGHHLAELDYSPLASIYAGFLVGSGHRGIGSYLNNVGIAGVSYAGRSSLPLGESYRTHILMEGAKKGTLTRNDLSVLLGTNLT